LPAQPGGARTQPQRCALQDSDKLAPNSPASTGKIRHTLNGLCTAPDSERLAMSHEWQSQAEEALNVSRETLEHD